MLAIVREPVSVIGGLIQMGMGREAERKQPSCTRGRGQATDASHAACLPHFCICSLAATHA